MHFIYQINRLTTTKLDSTYLGSLANNAQRIKSEAELERMCWHRLILSRHTGRHIVYIYKIMCFILKVMHSHLYAILYF